MTESAPTGSGNVVYPKFGKDTPTFEWPEHVDWSECAPDPVPEEALDSHLSEQDTHATVIEFPSRGDTA